MGLRLPESPRLRDIDQQCRTIDEIRRRNIDVVLDVGANKGFYSKHLRLIGFTGEILSFEPDPETFAHLRERAAGDPKWRVFNCALGDTAGEMDFHVINTGGETVLSSAFKPLGEGLDMTIKKVPVRTVEEVLRTEGVPASARIFMKMDTQGYDLMVFQGAAGVGAIELIQSEISVVPLYEGMPHYTESLLRYEQGGFELIDLFLVNRTPSGGVLEYDALMARRR